MRFALGPKARAAGYRLETHDTIGSTNAEALAKARQGDPGRLWVVSKDQTAGRGRRGRHWVTPAGNLATSLLLIVEEEPGIAATLGFVAGLSLDEALRRVAPDLAVAITVDGLDGRGRPSDRLRLKWPNDLLLDGGKLAGILLEAEPMPGNRLAVIVGIGVNVAAAPTDLPYRAAALAEQGFACGADDVFDALSDAWAGLERVWDHGRGFAHIRRLWLERAAGLGEEIVVRSGEEMFRGTFETIDGEGRLVVRSAAGRMHTVSAGEIHFSALASTSA